MSYSRVITFAAIATLVVAVLAVPRRPGLVPALTESSKLEASDSTAPATVAVASHPEPSVKNMPPPASLPVVETHDTASSAGSHSTSAAATITASAPAPAATEPNEHSQVTIAGCLESTSNTERFRLTDTEGAAAPKSRSWRTGFLTKHSTTVDLVGASDAAILQKQVGRRVAVTGVQTNRELKVGSVRVISPSCN